MNDSLATMTAAVVVESDGHKAIELQTVPRPVPGAGEVLVRVRSAGLNRADLALNVGHFRNSGAASGPAIPGVEFAGEVVAAGAGASAFSPGDRVMAMGQGAFAEFVRIHHRLLIRVPATMDFTQAGTAPVALMTAHDALVSRAGLQAGETVLVQAATSGVGIIACQIARMRGAGLVIGTSGSSEKISRLQAAGMGPDQVINPRAENTVERVMAATSGRGVDVIIDMLGGSCLNDNLHAAALRGRIVMVGRMGGARGELDLDRVALRRLTLIGVTFRTRSIDEIADVASAMDLDLAPALASGAIRWPVDRTFPLAEVAQAYTTMRANAHAGKIAVIVG
jgi:NADPH2:quinone reductase